MTIFPIRIRRSRWFLHGIAILLLSLALVSCLKIQVSGPECCADSFGQIEKPGCSQIHSRIGRLATEILELVVDWINADTEAERAEIMKEIDSKNGELKDAIDQCHLQMCEQCPE